MTLYLVIGPPAAGKSTWDKAQAKPGDITIDYDTIAEALGSTGHDHPDHIKAVTKAARLAAIDAALQLADRHDVYIIHANPSPALRSRYQQRGAQVITIDPGRDIVMARCKQERPWRIGQAAKEWYANPPTTTDATITDGHADTARQW